MQKSTEPDAIRARINGDIIFIIQVATELGWKPIREQSISRILYLSSVLYSFRHGKENNPFSDDYHFSIDSTGPFDIQIANSLIFLESNSYIERGKRNEITLGSTEPENLDQLPDFNVKTEWLRTIFYIIGIYGEGKIYEFIIRDPQYQENLQSNSVSEINIDWDNKTIEVLREFKSAFEESLKEDARQIDDKEYLRLYFDYIFSKIVKGEINL